MLDFGGVLLRFVSHLAILFVPDFTRFSGELKCAIHRVDTLGFDGEENGKAVLFNGGRGPRIEKVQLSFKSEDDTAGKAIGDDLLLQLSANPFSRAASQHGEVGIINRLGATIPGLLLEERFVPDGGEKADHSTVDVLASEELLEFAHYSSCLVIKILLACLCPSHLSRRESVDESFSSR